MKNKFLIIAIFIMLVLSGCNKDNKTNNKINNETNIIEDKITWDEISVDKVDEEKLLSNIDINVLEEIASLFQKLDNDIAKKEDADYEYVLKGLWFTDVLESSEFNKVLSMGNKAQKPLYYIIYKSENSGRYEYICALALEKLSGFNFDEDNDGIKWSTSKEFLNDFNNIILNN